MSGDLLTQLQAAQSDEDREWIVLQFSLNNLNLAVREAVWAIAIPHWFDAQFLATLLDKSDSESSEHFDTLIKFSFVEPFPGRGYDVHERSRSLLLKRLWHDDKEKYCTLSRRAADYCSRQDQSDTLWRVETIYHQLIAEPNEGASQLQDVGWEWHNPPNFAYSKVEALARAARTHADAGRLPERGLGWTMFWEALLDADYSRFQSAKERFLQIRIAPDIDQHLTGEVSFQLGMIYRILAEYDQARVRCEEALLIFRQIGDHLGEANCIRGLGDVHQMLREHRQAQARYEEALLLYQKISARLGEANCIRGLGDVHRMLREPEQAQRRYEEALPIYRQIGDQLGEANCVRGLGDVHYSRAEYERARTRYEEALLIYRKIGAQLGEANCVLALGDAHRRLREPEQARARYEEALLIYQKISARLGEANCVCGLGEVYRMRDEHEKAQARYNEALSLYQQIGDRPGEMRCLRGLGDLDRQKSHWAEAEQKYRQALAYYKSAGMDHDVAVILRCLGHSAQGAGYPAQAREYYQSALELFTRIGLPAAEEVQSDLDSLSTESGWSSNRDFGKSNGPKE